MRFKENQWNLLRHDVTHAVLYIVRALGEFAILPIRLAAQPHPSL